MKHMLRCLLLVLLPVLAYGAERRIEWISVLRPAAGTAAREVVHQITWSDGTEEVIVTPQRGAPAAQYEFRLGTGTYTSRIATPDPRTRMKAAANVGNTHEVCDPFDEQSCTPTSPETTMGTYYTAAATDVHGTTMASMGLMPCRGDKFGQYRIDYQVSRCIPGSLALSQCQSDPLRLGHITANPTFTVRGAFETTGAGSCGQSIEMFISGGQMSYTVSGLPGHSVILDRQPSSNYFKDPCGTVIHETGGSGGDDTDPPDDPDQPEDPGDDEEPPNSGDPICATVYDGQTGNYLGTCCGTTLEKIIKCAMEIK